MNRSIFTAVASAALVASFLSPVDAQRLPSELFARHAEVSEASLSPNGDYVALAIPTADGNETQLQVVHLADGKTQVLRFGQQNHVTDVTWTADGQLAFARAKMEPLKARPYSLGELMSSDIQGKTQKTLFAYLADDGMRSGKRKDEGFASLVHVLDDEPGMVLVAFRCWRCGEEPDSVIYKVDTRTGNRQEVERVGEPATFTFDRRGVARVMVTYDKTDEPKLQYRPVASGAWQPMPASLAGYVLSGGRFDADGNTLYATVSDHGEPEQLYKLDLAQGTRTRLAGRDDVDVAHLLYAGRGGIPFGAVFDAAKPSVQYLDPASEWSQLHAGLMQLFPGEMVDLLDFSRDNRTLLFAVASDRHPGAYYVLDRDSNAIRLIAETKPWLDPAKLASTQSIEFTSRDGRRVFGFYTAPTGGAMRPLVVLPHGGPHGPYDRWGYDEDAQFLANRGYGVLQVNYRGSGGRGVTYEKDGYRQWGGTVQDDIADGVKWAIAQKLADPAKVCTFGASFGGYAALMNPIRNPGMYRCAAGYVGVYDLSVMKKEGDIPGSRFGRRYLDRVLGVDDAVLIENSPAQQVAKIGIPVFLIQGEIDRRVPMDQFHAMSNAFKKAGTPIETMVVAGEGHGFYKPANRAQLYERLGVFLDRHLGSAAAP